MMFPGGDIVTNKSIVSVVIDPDELDEIIEYQHKNLFKSQSKAIMNLIRLGMDKERQLSESEKQMIGALGKLNAEGKKYLLDFADTLIKSKKFQ